MNDEKFVKSIMTKNVQLLVYERETYSQIGFKTGDSMRNFVLFEINMVQPKKNYMIFT
jgi:hypothetical protein